MGLHFIKNGTKHGVCVKRPSLFPASATTYDNSQSGLSATRVQGAIDELAPNAKEFPNYTAGTVSNITTTNNAVGFDCAMSPNNLYFNSSNADYVIIYVNDAVALVGTVPSGASNYRPFTGLLPLKAGDEIRYAIGATATVVNNGILLFPYR
jgi:hypothetical protein